MEFISFLWIGAQFPQEKFLSYGRILTLHYYFLLYVYLIFMNLYKNVDYKLILIEIILHENAEPIVIQILDWFPYVFFLLDLLYLYLLLTVFPFNQSIRISIFLSCTGFYLTFFLLLDFSFFELLFILGLFVTFFILRNLSANAFFCLYPYVSISFQNRIGFTFG